MNPWPGKFCKDCKYAFPSYTPGQKIDTTYIWQHAVVCRKEVNGLDPVSGEIIFHRCWRVRENLEQCGPEGRWFEAIETT